MNSFFDLDNPAWRFIGKIFDACFLSIVYVIFCIPIFTIGAANTALYYVFLKLAKDEEGYLVRDFIKSFKRNFKQSTLVWLILFTIGLVLILDIYYFKFMPGPKGAFMYYMFWMLFFFYSILNLYIFPLISKFENTTRNMFKFSFAMPIKHFGWTTLMVVFNTVVILSAIRIPPILIFVPGILAFFNSYIFNHIFDIYIRKMQEVNSIEEDK
ncbi:DUF624 domain-containing protein [uncultured Tyzzerella sp.]|uniref:YesL family protein n=1 Tax=uncultured Tyzzerella sp. TaxID=2321398 RepID=UPI002943B6FE|nr:DUF624 domain-containing protein [uncultured Tyzzerella sp.]